MAEPGSLPAGSLEEVARRLGTLSADKRRLFVARLEERGIDIGKLPIVAAPRPERIPLSYAQQRLWIVDQLDPGAALYNLATTLKLRGRLDAGALRGALEALVARHEALRTCFVADGGTPAQVVVADAAMAVPCEDLSALPAPEREGRARALAAEEAAVPFDVARAPLLRARLLVLSDDEHWLLLTMHHIITDEWSNAILVAELIELYAVLSRGEGSALTPLRIQYADYALWQRAWLEGTAVKRQLEYWAAQLGGGDYVLALPSDLPRPPRPSTEGAGHRLVLGRALKDRLAELANRAGATLFMTVLAGFQILLARYAGQREIRIGVPIANRNRAEVDGVVGFFSNTQVLRGEVRGADSTREHLQRVRAVVLEAQANQDLPFERLVEALQPERRASQNPLFDVMLSWHHEEARDPAQSGLAIDWEVPPERVAKFDLCLHVTEGADGLSAELVYRTDLFHAVTIEAMGARLEVVLAQMARYPDRPLATLEWLDEADRARIAGWNPAPVSPVSGVPVVSSVSGVPVVSSVSSVSSVSGDEANISAWLLGVARAHPEVIAVRAGGQCLTYGELEARAGRLASRLMAVGIGCEARVALCLPRSIDFIVGLWAVLQCGAAYVPLDPKLPAARLRALVEDSGAAVVVGAAELGETMAGLAEVVDPAGVEAEPGPDASGPDASGPAASGPAASAIGATAPRASNAAYVMYTSGSTGRPKGVVVTHGGLCHYVRGMLARLALPAGASMAMVSTVAADLGNTVLFGALCSGGTLHLLSEEQVFDADAMGRYMTEHAVDVLKIVPQPREGPLAGDAPGAGAAAAHADPRRRGDRLGAGEPGARARRVPDLQRLRADRDDGGRADARASR